MRESVLKFVSRPEGHNSCKEIWNQGADQTCWFKSGTATKYWRKLQTDKFLNSGMGKDGGSTFLGKGVNRRSYTLPKTRWL